VNDESYTRYSGGGEYGLYNMTVETENGTLSTTDVAEQTGTDQESTWVAETTQTFRRLAAEGAASSAGLR
jgi:hypothetical protein